MIGSRMWQIAGWTMLHYLWVGAVLGIVAVVVRRLLRSAGANLRYLIALGSLLLLSIAPAAIAVVVTQNLAPAAHSVPLPLDSVIQPEAMRLDEFRPTMAATDIPLPAATAGLPAEAPQARANERLLAALDLAAMYLPWLWVCGTPLSFVLIATGVLGAERLRRQSRPLEDAPITEMCRRLAASLKISYHVGVAVCDRIAVPILVGVLRPMILLPAVALAGWDPRQLEMVLLHELAHVRRYDNLVNLLQRIVESVLFFQPMVWVISGWVRREREHCCDELVVARTRQPQAYAEMLVNLSETLSQNPRRSSSLVHPQAVSSMAERPLVARIRRILKKEEQAMQVSRKAVGLVFMGIITVVVLIAGYCSLPGYAEDSSTAPKGPSSDASAEPKLTTSTETPGSEKTTVAASAPIPPDLQKPIIGKNYVIIPLHTKTELLRNLRWDAAEAKLFIVINGRALLDDKDTQLNASAFDYTSFLESLYKYKIAGVRGRIIVEIEGVPDYVQDVRLATEDDKHKPEERPLRASQALWGLLSHEGSVIGPILITYRNNRDDKNLKDWKALVAELTTPPTEEGIRREAGVSDGLMAAHPICTPLSHYLVRAGDRINCVIRNVKSFSDLTPEETGSLLERAKPLIAKLALKEPPRVAFVVAYGDSWSKIRRAERQLSLSDCSSLSKAMGVDIQSMIMWDAGRVGRQQALRVRVVGDDGSPVNDATVTAVFPPETRELYKQNILAFHKENDDRWLCGFLPDDEEFTLTVAAKGYEPNSQKLKVALGEIRDLVVKLKPAGSKANDPSGKTSAEKPAAEKDQAEALVRAITEIEKLGGKVTVDKSSPAKPVISVRLARTQVHDAQLEHLRGLTQLQSLDLWDTQITDAGLANLKGLSKLQSLELGSTQVRDAGLEHLRGLLQLESLDLRGDGQITDAGLVNLRGLSKLQSLKLSQTQVTDAGLEHLKGLTQLQLLDLLATRITDKGLEHLKPLIRLQTLSVGANKITDAGLEYLKGLTQLQNLNLAFTTITDAGLEHLKGLTQLQSLFLACTKVSDAGLVHLEGLSQLQTLILAQTQVTDAGLEHLQGLTNLQTLDLRGTQVTDTGLDHLQGLLQLQSLNLTGTNVTDKALEHLKGLERLQSLGAGGAQVSDVGLEHLRGLTKLWSLNLSETKVTGEGVKALQQALPNCKIDWSPPTPPAR